MLVLARKVGQKIVIGDGLVTITILNREGDLFRLGFDADPGIPIHREEVYERIKREKQEKKERHEQ